MGRLSISKQFDTETMTRKIKKLIKTQLKPIYFNLWKKEQCEKQKRAIRGLW